jgi:hypothetical protein
MGLESATYISQLTATNPTASDPVSQGDDHLRLIKSVLQSQFTTLGAAAVTTTAAELNLLDGVTSVTYTAGDGLDLTGQAFSTDLVSNGGLEIQSTELSVAQGISQYDVAQFAASVVDNDFLRIATTSVEGRSAAEVLSDIAALPLAGGTMSGETIFADQLATRFIAKDYSETIHTGGNTSTAVTLDEENGNVQTFTMTGNCTFTMPSGSGLQPGASMTLILTQDGTGSRTGAFTSVKWAGGTAPTLTTTATSGIDIITFYTFNGGASPVWYGFLSGAAMA